MTHPSHRRITVTEIAHLAGVGVSAVSNWRNRYRDFPAPAERIPGGDVFDLSSVVAWLEIHGRTANLALPSVDHDLWTLADRLRGTLQLDDAVLVTLQALYVGWRIERLGHGVNSRPELALWRKLVDGLPDGTQATWRRIVAALAESAPELELVLSTPAGVSEGDLWHAVQAVDALSSVSPHAKWGAMVTAFLKRVQGTFASRSAGMATPTSITQLMVQLLAPIEGIVYDPAAGHAMFLSEAAQQASGTSEFLGQEVLESSWRIGYLHLALQDVDFKLDLGDTLRADRFRSVRASRIGLDTPLGERFHTQETFLDERWAFGATTSAEWMWAQHLLFHLDATGVGVMVVPAGALSRPGRDAHIRKSIATEGSLDAVIELPPGLVSGTAISMALLLFDRNRSDRANSILFMDARQLGVARRGKTHELTPDDIDRVLATVSAWRAGSFQDEPLFSAAAPIGAIIDHAADLSPKRYVRYTTLAEDGTGAATEQRVAPAAEAALASLEALKSVEQRVGASIASFDPGVASDWPLVKVKDLVAAVPQTGIRQDVASPGPSFPWIPTRLVSSGTGRLTALPEERTHARVKGRLARRGDLLLVSRGINTESRIGCATVDFDGEAAFSESLMLLSLDTNRVVPDYLRIALTSQSGRIALAAATTGSVIANLRRDTLEEVEVRLPDLQTQERIVAGLRDLEQSVSELDRALEATRALHDALRDEVAAGRYMPTEGAASAPRAKKKSSGRRE